MARARRLHPRQAPGAPGAFTHRRCQGTGGPAALLPGCDVFSSRCRSPQNILCWVKAVRAGRGVRGAGFSIAGEGGDTLPDRLVGGTRPLLCSRCSPPRLRAGSRVVFHQLCSCLLALPRERCLEVEGEGNTFFLCRPPKQSGVRSRVPFRYPHPAPCSLGLCGCKAPRLAPALP